MLDDKDANNNEAVRESAAAARMALVAHVDHTHELSARVQALRPSNEDLNIFSFDMF